MTKLSVNLNKFALLRNSRGADSPNLLAMARRTIASGAQGITAHPRPDQRHIRYADVHDIAQLLAEYPAVEFNIEGNPTPEFLALVRSVRPAQCTLVPDKPGQLTSDHGWNLREDGASLTETIRVLQDAGIRVSLFVDTELEHIAIAREIGADRIELYTESYAKNFGTPEHDATYRRYHMAAEHALKRGLGVNAGHDLNLSNLETFLTIPRVSEVSIGHAIVVESFDFGYEEVLRRYLEITNRESAKLAP